MFRSERRGPLTTVDFKRCARFARVAPRAGDFVGLEQVEKRMELVRAERQRQRKARGLPDLD